MAAPLEAPSPLGFVFLASLGAALQLLLGANSAQTGLLRAAAFLLCCTAAMLCCVLCSAGRDYETQVADGRLLAGHNDTYHGNQPLTYGCDPAENVVFVGCHDNETIFDQVGRRAPGEGGGGRGHCVVSRPYCSPARQEQSHDLMGCQKPTEATL